ncbi:hypothetical protein B0T37_07930 [Chromobacterium violaceum]|uniref:hypothetical protein n=1 Tax=Chromobacterium violaceum TaxID=536 RepID=UPI0009DB3745|nr:hypothetical protein [Chromobacterium violaceum]OQS11362.1 hypothetical protein B0T38_05290 [Chromobacterium violaceum]OQS27786.1 hypothetical protein B0T37_07930 [Chromobacterium violaceum]
MKSVPFNKGKNKLFATEATLVERFVGVLQSGRTQYGPVQIITEWDHKAGLVDILARDCEQSLLAFEAKLLDWRRAFFQAYRNAAYANRTYVLLPMDVAQRALQGRDDFEFRGIGLCGFDGKAIHILIEAIEQDALLKWVRNRAHEHFNGLPDDRSRSKRRSSRNSTPKGISV